MSRRGKIGSLLFFIGICAMAVFMPRWFQFRTAHVRPAELFSVVYRQVNAVQADNFSGAYEQASGTFQRKFNLPQFISLVRSNYAGISSAVRVEFGPVESRGDCAKLSVYFIDSKGQVTPCIYTLVNEGEAWKIENATVLRRWSEKSRIAGLRI